MTKKKRNGKPVKEGTGIVLGIIIGGAIGLATNSLALAISLGVGLGVSFETANRKKYDK